LVIADMLYDATERQQVKDNAATYAGVPPQVIAGGVAQPSGSVVDDGCTPLTVGCQQALSYQNGIGTLGACTGVSPGAPAGWTAVTRQWKSVGGGPPTCYNAYLFSYNGSNGANRAQTSPGVPTTQNVSDYLGSLPSSNSLAPEQQNQAAGTTNPAPVGADST